MAYCFDNPLTYVNNNSLSFLDNSLNEFIRFCSSSVSWSFLNGFWEKSKNSGIPISNPLQIRSSVGIEGQVFLWNKLLRLEYDKPDFFASLYNDH